MIYKLGVCLIRLSLVVQAILMKKIFQSSLHCHCMGVEGRRGGGTGVERVIISVCNQPGSVILMIPLPQF